MKVVGRATLLVSVALLLTMRCGGTVQTESVVGPAGGVVGTDGAWLSVPAGALSTNVTIRIQSLPAETNAASRTFRFIPLGLPLAIPAEVAIRPDIATSSPMILWQTSSAPMALPTTVQSDGWAHASVLQLGSGYVVESVQVDGGGLDATADGALDATMDVAGDVGDDSDAYSGSNDGGSSDSGFDATNDSGSSDSGFDATNDSGSSDSGVDGGMCIAQPIIISSNTLLPSVGGTNIPTQSFQCGIPQLPPPHSIPFTLTASNKLAFMWVPHQLAPAIDRGARLSAGCDLNGQVLFADGPCELSGTALQPGTYTFTSCNTAQDMYLSIEDPPPAALNTSCNSPQTLARNVPYTEARIVNVQERYYSFTVSNMGLGPYSLKFTSPERNGMPVGVSIRTTCNNPQTEVLNNKGVIMCSNNFDYAFANTNLNPGTYYAVVTNITYGQRYDIVFE